MNLDWGNLLRIELVPAVVRTAGDLAEVYGLRGFDAICLASAMWLKEKTGTPLYFAVFDQRLRAAAERAGLAVGRSSRRSGRVSLSFRRHSPMQITASSG